MIRKAQLVALLTAVLGTWAGWATPACPAQGLPASPVPTYPTPDAGLPAAPPPATEALPPPVLTPPTTLTPPPTMTPPLAPYPVQTGPIAVTQPLPPPPPPGTQPPGWFADVELSILAPRLTSSVTGNVNVSGLFTDTVQLPNANLDWTVAPRFILGYRMCDGNGEISVAYQSVATSGTATLPGFDIDGSTGMLKTRLDMNVVDIDYGSPEYRFFSSWTTKWSAGVRIADVFFDSHAVGYYLDQRSSNEYAGAGPHLGLSLWRTFGSSDLSFYGHVDGSVLFGDIRQEFDESITFPDGTVIGGTTITHHDRTVPVVNGEVGLSWAPRYSRHAFRLTGGYQFNEWWDVGQSNGNQANVMLQGIFLRGQWSF